MRSFRASFAVSIDSAFVTLRRLSSLLRNHLPSIYAVRTAPIVDLSHSPLFRHTPRVHSRLDSPRKATVASASSQPSCPSCSVLVVSLDFDGFLHTVLAGLLRPATGYEVDGVSELPSTPLCRHRNACLAWPIGLFPNRLLPLEEFPSTRAVPRLRSLVPS